MVRAAAARSCPWLAFVSTSNLPAVFMATSPSPPTPTVFEFGEDGMPVKQPPWPLSPVARIN